VIDTNGSGTGDTMFVDADGDGLADARMADPGETGAWSDPTPLSAPAPEPAPAPAAPEPTVPDDPAPTGTPSVTDTLTALVNWRERETDPFTKEQIQRMIDFFTENPLARPWVE
jgi:hypothetical protein